MAGWETDVTTAEVMSLLLLTTVCAGMLIGFPVAWTLAGISILFAFLGAAVGVFDVIFLTAIPSRRIRT